jgi:hypothetical protein
MYCNCLGGSGPEIIALAFVLALITVAHAFASGPSADAVLIAQPSLFVAGSMCLPKDLFCRSSYIDVLLLLLRGFVSIKSFVGA